MTTYTLQILVEGKDQASGPLGGIGGALSRMGEIAGGIISAQMLTSIARQILDIGAQAINATAQMQTFEMGLSTLLSRELRAADGTLSLNDALDQAAPLAEKLAGKLRDIAIQSPYRLGTIQDTFRLAMAFGFASDEAMSFTNGILNMAAGVGATDDMLQRMSYNLAQIRMQGKVTAMDVRQLAMAGFDLNGALSGIGEQFGLTINDYEDFNAAIAAGKITWEQFAGAFEKYANEQFGGAAQRMSRTFEGLKSTFSDLFILTMPQVFGPALQVVTDFLNGILNKFIDLSNSGALEEAGKKFGDFTQGVIDYLSNLSAVFQDTGDVLSPEFIEALFAGLPQQSQDIINGFISPIREGFNNLKQTLSEAEVPAKLTEGFNNIKAFWDQNGPGLIAIFQDVWGTLVTKFSELAGKTIPWFVTQFDKVTAWYVKNGPLIQRYVSQVAEVFKYVINAVVSFWNVVEPLLSGIIDIVLKMATLMMQVATGDWSGAWETMKQITATAWATIWNTLVAALDWIAGLFGTSLADIGQWFSDTWNGIVQGVKDFWNNLIGSSSEGSDNAGSGIIGWLDSIGQWFTDLWNNIVTGLTTFWTNLVTGFQVGFNNFLISIGITEEVRERWRKIWDDIVLIVTVVWQRITAAVNEKIAAFIAWITPIWQGVWQAVGDTFSAIWGAISGVFTAAWDWLKNAASTAWNAIVSVVSAVFAPIINVLTPIINNIKTTFSNAWSDIKTSVSSKFSEIVTAVGGKVTEIWQKIKDKIGDFLQVGKDIADGIKQGIQDGWKAIIEWVTGGVERLIAKIKKDLGIASPSKVMEDLFYFVPAGAAVGIQAGAPLMENAMNNAVNGMIAEPYANVSNVANYATPVSSASGSTVNYITINVSGSDDPEKVADVIFKRMKAQGVTIG
jgi:tape measure domain-containing protein